MKNLDTSTSIRWHRQQWDEEQNKLYGFPDTNPTIHTDNINKIYNNGSRSSKY